MTGKQNMVFWIGLIIILVNFWVSAQSTTLWQTLTATGVAKPQKGSTPNKNARTGTNTHGGVQ